MIGYIWLLWGLNQLFMLIMLLNFLIAIISQTYETVISASAIGKYKARCEFNLEVTQIVEIYNSWKGIESIASVFSISAHI